MLQSNDLDIGQLELSNLDKQTKFWVMCGDCLGRGKRSRRIRKKVRLEYQKALEAFRNDSSKHPKPVKPKGHLEMCASCSGLGIVLSDEALPVNESLPKVAIIGAGIGGMALAVACKHRGIPFTLYERDSSFDARSQGYGLTLQQASRAISGLGIIELEDGVVSTRHMVHNTEGKVVAEWGMRRWLEGQPSAIPKRSNIHIARQSLRFQMMEQLGGTEEVHWGHQLVSFDQTRSDKVQLTFLVNGEQKYAEADLVVGADGIRSVVRQSIIGDEVTPLRSLNCMVVLGICPLSLLGDLESELLDGATVFQTANGNDRIYMMPFNAESVMWQLSFRMDDDEAKALSEQGSDALKAEAIRRLPWHSPIPEILAATPAELVSGYPVYDRELLTPEHFANSSKATLIGDGAHPMTPFKGQGANQAILDALSLAREITNGCWSEDVWRNKGLREAVLNTYETEMLERSAVKVEGSAAAAEFLHSDVVLEPIDQPRRMSPKD